MAILTRCSRVLGALAQVLLLALASSLALAEEPASVTEISVKAAFVFKFIAFVEWPPGSFAQPDSPVVIGVYAADDLADELARVVVSRNIGGRGIVVRRLRRAELDADLQMLFVGRDGAAELDQLLVGAERNPTLIVTEFADGLDLGGAINFVVVENKVRFDVALAAASERQIKISSRLLAVARKVDAGPP
jgi:hypothetical protein